MAEGLLDGEGRLFDAHGRKSSCTSRLCPHCIKLIQRRAQKRLVTARDNFWNLYAPESGKYERFSTLTAPTLQGVAEYEAEKIYNRAFQLLTYRPFWFQRVEAGAKHLEFTVTPHGYHPHIHVMTYGSYLERDAEQEQKSKEWRERRARERAEKAEARGMRLVKDEPLRPHPILGNLQDHWTSCVTIAARECGYVMEWAANFDEEFAAPVLGNYCRMDTRAQIVPAVKLGAYSQYPLTDGEVIQMQPTPARKAGVDVRLVREKGQPSSAEIGITSAVKELTKYITKASSWNEVSDEHLVEIAEVKRWPRCFELLGSWRKVPTVEDAFAAVFFLELAKTGESLTSLLVRLRCHTRPRPIIKLEPDETWGAFCERVGSENADPASYVIAWDALNTPRERRRRIESAAQQRGANASLDTDFLFRSEVEVLGHSPPDKKAARARARSLMERGEVLPFHEWLKIVDVRLLTARRARQKLISKHYHYNPLFLCLDGSTFAGTDYQHTARMPERVREAEKNGEALRARWAEMVSSADLTKFRESVREQEREDWHAYIEYGSEAVAGWFYESGRARNESAHDRRRFQFRNLAADYSLDESENKIARAFALELSGKMKE
jgi:hypothetical protein